MAVQRFKVGCFNLLNLASPGVRFYPNEPPYSEAKYEEKKAWIGAQLRRMDADVIGFQEVWHLEALADTLGESGIYEGANILLAERDDEADVGPVVGLVSRFPILASQAIQAFPDEAHLFIEGEAIPITNFSRPVLQAKIEIDSVAGNVEATVFVVHLKSKRPLFRDGADRDNPLEQAIGYARSLMLRAAEATALRSILLDTMQNNKQPVFVVGDINDAVTAVTSEIVTGTAPYRYLSLAKKQRIWDALLYNVKDIQSRKSLQDFYYTHIFNGHYDSLDHILVSNEFVDENRERLGYVEYVKVFNDHLIDETLSSANVLDTQSDHGQVVADIRFREPAP
jgi:hypothetical protein